MGPPLVALDTQLLPRVLVVAPRGRDSEIAAVLLQNAGFAVDVCGDLQQIEDSLSDATAFAVITEESLDSQVIARLSSFVATQDSWSDLPFIVLTKRGVIGERHPNATRIAETLGNVSFLERPFHPTTFGSLARTAWKGRQRQYEVRQHIVDARQNAHRLRQMNETLEERVLQRTAELERAHAKSLAEMRQREALEDQLRQTQKMEMVGQLTGGVAHDFNNLLSAIVGNLDLLRRHLPENPRLSRYVDGALQGARRGAALTQRLLAFARRQSLQIEPVDVVRMVSGMENLILRSLGDQVELRLDLPPHGPRALADANQLELALLNLIINARDAMPEGGRITVRVDEPPTPLISAATEQPRFVRLAVDDTGVGMDEQTLRRATEPFFSTKGLGKGTGLGLSMVHGLAHQLNGRLNLSSIPGKGTTAELWLPATHEEAKLEEKPAKEVVTERTAVTILVVDDDVLIAMSTVDMLEDLGHDVIEVHSGAEAIDVLRNDKQIDLLITDYSMPKMTGLQLAETALTIRPELPILLATGYAEIPEGAHINLPRLSKPYQQSDLAAEIDRLLK